MKLLTAEIIKKFESTPLYTNENITADKTPILVKFFHPMSSYTLYVTEASKQEDGDWLMFGLVVNQYGKELGYTSFNELAKTKVRGLPMERDMYFGKHFLSEFQNSH